VLLLLYGIVDFLSALDDSYSETKSIEIQFPLQELDSNTTCHKCGETTGMNRTRQGKNELKKSKKSLSPSFCKEPLFSNKENLEISGKFILDATSPDHCF